MAAESGGRLSGLMLPQVVQQICSEGTALRWDAAAGCYHVLDGEAFERRFDDLRRKRKRGEGAQTHNRPFSRMHKHYTLLAGDGWAKTGSKFIPVSAACSAEATATAVSAEAKRMRCEEASPGDGDTGWGGTIGSSCLQDVKRLQAQFTFEAREVQEQVGTEEPGDRILSIDLVEALCVLNDMVVVEEASDAQKFPPEHTWKLRSLHLGEGIFCDKDRQHLLRGFLLWSQSPQDRAASRFNVSKAMRRLRAFAHIQEKYYETYWSEPFTEQELQDVDDDASFKLVTDLMGLQVAPWHSSCGHPIMVQGFKSMEDSMLSSDANGTRTKDKILALAGEPGGKARLERAVMRCLMCLYLAMSFDDAANAHGIIQVMLVDKIEFGTMLKVSSILDRIQPILTEMVYNMFPVRACRKCIWVGTPWWIKWVLCIFSMFGGQEKRDMVIQTDLPGLCAMLGGRQYLPTCSGMKDYVMTQCGQSHSPASASPHPCPLLPPAPTSPPAAPAHDSSEKCAADDEEQSGWQQHGRTLLREAAAPRSPPPAASARLTDSWRFVNYVQNRMKIAPEELKPTALLRMRQLHALFLILHDSSIVCLEYTDDKPPSPAACSSAAAAACADSDTSVWGEAASIFGWSRVYVKDMTRFNARVRDMVEADVFKCWHANGRPTLRQPTNAVYEVLRQVGIHPVKGTSEKKMEKGCVSSCAAAEQERDLLVYSEYAFCADRMQRNCYRLRISQNHTKDSHGKDP